MSASVEGPTARPRRANLFWPAFWGLATIAIAIVAVAGGIVAIILLALPGLGTMTLAIWTYINAAAREAKASSVAASADLDGWLDEHLGDAPVAVVKLTPATPGPAIVYPAAHARGYDLVSETSESSAIGTIIVATLRRRDA